ncbi:conserved hypothetical protein [Neospora caninum Liverpool]|uniref:Tetratricopeptide repeat-containing protein n=1 Tax=Neospora caninum (strain Liverpool) TaxID=572307 RepID=F0V8T8_NEOCL|nr:conserved hypothetical protein [Neospora caninum Liverpool]CBZ50129.1 conserved hypothetical protein [Neospora caninum Liverpool]CEL64723.1 TPA: tetratricopeptide repeat-containing protein [Neospora caninum Liverpool]|eukprot:XP_003880164.1 conserved hypothetical protein [Neospora caninum Liverpool]
MATDDVTLLDIDSEKIEKCTQPRLLRKYIALLEQDGGYYHQLLSAARKRLDDLVGSKPSSGVGAASWCRGPSPADIAAAKADLLEWQRSLCVQQRVDLDAAACATSIPRDAQISTECGSKEGTPESTTIAIPSISAGGGQVSRTINAVNVPECFSQGENSPERGFKITALEAPPNTLECTDGAPVQDSKEGVESYRDTSSRTAAHSALPNRGTDTDVAVGVHAAEESVRTQNTAETVQHSHAPLKRRISVLLDESDAPEDSEPDEDDDHEFVRSGHQSRPKQFLTPVRRQTSSQASSSASAQIMQSKKESSSECATVNCGEGTAVTSRCCFAERDETEPNAPRCSHDESDTWKGIHTPNRHADETAEASLPRDCEKTERSNCVTLHDDSLENSSQKLLPAGQCGDNLSDMRTKKIYSLKGAAVAAYDEGNHEKALMLLTESLKIAEEGVLAAGEPAYASPTDHFPNASLRVGNKSAENKLPLKLHSVLYSNRSQVHLTLGQYAQAAEDSLRAMQLDSANIKALWRRARALVALGGHDNLDLASTIAKRIEDAFHRGETDLPPSAVDQLSQLQASINRATEQRGSEPSAAPHSCANTYPVL